jgi:hypothetical protein
VADALAYAHVEGILHRDVKPGNIILDSDGAPRLTDFGLALDLRAPGLTRTGEVFGSPKYMSPEQALRRDAPLDERTDVYSLAVTLFELLTLRLPYDATTGPQFLTALVMGKLVAPRVADRSMPEPLAAVLTRALRKDPRERYRTASDFAADLRAAIAGETISPAATAGNRKRRMSRRRVALVMGKLVAPRVADRSMPEPLAAVLTRALRKDPRERYRTATAFAADLRAAVAGETISAAAAEGGRKRGWTRRRAALVVGAGLSIGLLVGLVWDEFHAPAHDFAAGLGIENALTTGQLQRLAEGTEPDGEQLLRSAFVFEEKLRSVVSRHDLGTYVCAMTHTTEHIEPLDKRIAAVASWEVSVNRGEWQEVGDAWISIAATPAATPAVASDDTATVSIKVSNITPLLSEVLGDLIASDSFVIRHRATLRVANVSEDWTADAGAPLVGGTHFTWTGDERTLLVYDRYPADYPEVVTGQDVDERMDAALRPESIQFEGVDAVGKSRVLRLVLRRRDSKPPLNAAFEVEVWTVDGVLVGKGPETHRRAEEPREGATEDAGTSSGSVLVALDGAQPETEARVLLDLESGKTESLRLVFRPSRKDALNRPEFDSYWGGTIDAAVPVIPWDPNGMPQ